MRLSIGGVNILLPFRYVDERTGSSKKETILY